FELYPVHCDLVTIVGEVVSQLIPEAARSGCNIELRTATPVYGNFDRMRVGQIVTNLLSNAIKYGNKKPVLVSVHSHGDQAVVSVTDKGIGIPINQQSHIIERFSRGLGNAGVSGLGLGLYISQEIAKAH